MLVTATDDREPDDDDDDEPDPQQARGASRSYERPLCRGEDLLGTRSEPAILVGPGRLVAVPRRVRTVRSPFAKALACVGQDVRARSRAIFTGRATGHVGEHLALEQLAEQPAIAGPQRQSSTDPPLRPLRHRLATRPPARSSSMSTSTSTRRSSLADAGRPKRMRDTTIDRDRRGTRRGSRTRRRCCRRRHGERHLDLIEQPVDDALRDALRRAAVELAVAQDLSALSLTAPGGGSGVGSSASSSTQREMDTSSGTTPMHGETTRWR